MCETNIGVAHNTDTEKMELAAASSWGNLKIPKSPGTAMSKYLNHCKCTSQIQCSVCNLPMNRINPLYKSIVTNAVSEGVRKSRSDSSVFNQLSENRNSTEHLKLDFSEWFSWCQTCKHTGHLEHMEEWFTEHNECPVPDCRCECKLYCPV